MEQGLRYLDPLQKFLFCYQLILRLSATRDIEYIPSRITVEIEDRPASRYV